jgi:1,2-diacylglycerol 3-alpha-glucosyltransferase
VKILMISDVYFPRINGVSTSIRTFRESLARLGHVSWLIAPRYGPEDAAAPDIVRIPSRYLFLDPEDRVLRIREIRALERRLALHRFDLVHIQTPFIAHRAGVWLARRLRVPVVESYHTYFEEYLSHYVPFLPAALGRSAARRFTRRQCNRVDAVVVPSVAMQAVLRGYGVSVPATVIPTGIEPGEFRRSSGRRFRERHGIGHDRPVLVYVGRVAYEKNIGFLLEVLCAVREQIDDALLVIAGEGPARGALRARSRRLGIEQSIRFTDYLPRGEALWDCFCAGDVFVFASCTETQGLVLLEAMALGVPVVSTAVMGTRDIVAPGRGAIVAEPGTEDFARKVVMLLRDQALRTRLGEEAQDYVKQWSATRAASRMAAFYREVVAESAPAGGA